MLLVWASPNTLLGLTWGTIGCLTGGRVRRRGRTIEFWGGAVEWTLRRLPLAHSAAAMTIGHVILGQDLVCLDACRDHEMVHVRQYERWGPLFLPAYAVGSLWAWYKGKHPYYDNPFEREAYATTRVHFE